MQTLRVKLHIPTEDPQDTARAVFDELADVHSDQAIFQVNESEYIDDDSWGFRVTYRSQKRFVRSTSPADIERVMRRVAPNSFERRLSKG